MVDMTMLSAPHSAVGNAPDWLRRGLLDVQTFSGTHCKPANGRRRVRANRRLLLYRRAVRACVSLRGSEHSVRANTHISQ